MTRPHFLSQMAELEIRQLVEIQIQCYSSSRSLGFEDDIYGSSLGQ